jgi:hypothetical protein
MTTRTLRLRASCRLALLATASSCVVTLALGCALHQARTQALPRPGTYRVTFRSEGSSRLRSGVVQGRLWLAVVPAGARSDGAPLYGSMTLDPTTCAFGDAYPPPSSRDPREPGVLVVRDDEDGIELLVSSCWNVQPCYDGCGVRLKPGRSSTATWISGTWENEGLIPGFGTFDAVWLH